MIFSMEKLPKNKDLCDLSEKIVFSAAKKAMRFWIEPKVRGLDSFKSELTLKTKIFYALLYESTTDLVLLDLACKIHKLPPPFENKSESFFFIRKSEGLFGRKTVLRIPPQILQMTDTAKNTPHEKVLVVPVSFFWGHQPERENSIGKFLFSEYWKRTSQAKRIIAAMFYPRHIYLEFGEFLNVSNIAADQKSGPRKTRKILRILRTSFKNQKRAVLGPDLSNREKLIKTVLGSKRVEEAISRESSYLSIKPHKARKKASKYAREIFADQSYRTVRFFDTLLKWLWNNLYSGIQVHNIEKVKKIAETHALIYVPCHRSHIDYLLLSYVLYHKGLTPPHIAAGKNLNLLIVGALLRKGGAFFMRRSFQNDTLYKAVFEEYLGQLFSRGYSVEYFIEGTRSRTGRILKPKTGLLRMTIQNFLQNPTKKIAFVPVYIGYERILEAHSYKAEIGGEAKKPENLLDLIKILRLFKNNFGTVRVNFSSPIKLSDCVDTKTSRPILMAHQNSDQRSKFLSFELATHLACKINESIVIGPINIFASVCTASKGKPLDRKTLLERIDLFKLIASRCAPGNSFLVETTSLDVLTRASTILGVNLDLENPTGSLQRSENQTDLCSYYANNSLPIFILPALALNFIRNRKSFSKKEFFQFITAIFYITKLEYFLPWDIKNVDKVSHDILSVFEETKLIREKSSKFQTCDVGSQEEIISGELASLGADFIKCLHIIGVFLNSERETSTKQFKKLIKGLSLSDTSAHEVDFSILKDRGLEVLGLFHELEHRDLYKEEQEFKPRLNDLLLATKAATNKKFRALIDEKVEEIQIPK